MLHVAAGGLERVCPSEASGEGLCLALTRSGRLSSLLGIGPGGGACGGCPHANSLVGGVSCIRSGKRRRRPLFGSDVLADGLLTIDTTSGAGALVGPYPGPLEHADKLEALHCLWQATKDRAHLEEAHRLLMDTREHVSDEYRDTMLQNVPLNRDLMKAWEEHGEKR